MTWRKRTVERLVWRDYGFREGQFPVAEEISRRTLALPFFPQIEAEDQARVVEALRAAVERR